MTTVDRPPVYKAHLLRCWLDGDKWRYSLEEVGSGKRSGFATLDELVAFLIALSALPYAEPKGLDVEGDRLEM